MDPNQSSKSVSIQGDNFEAMRKFVSAIIDLIPVYSGKPEDLNIFVASVEAAKKLASPQMNHTLFEVVKTKIQGPAKESIKDQSFGNWDELRSFLASGCRNNSDSPNLRSLLEKDKTASGESIPDSTQGNGKSQKINVVPLEKLTAKSDGGTQVSGNFVNVNPSKKIKVVPMKGGAVEVRRCVTLSGVPHTRFLLQKPSCQPGIVKPVRPVIQLQHPGPSNSFKIRPSGSIPRPVAINISNSPQTNPTRSVQYVVTKEAQTSTKPVVLSSAGVLIIQIPPKRSAAITNSEEEELSNPEKFSGQNFYFGDVFTQTDAPERENKDIQVGDIRSTTHAECQTVEIARVSRESQTDEELTKFEEDLKTIAQLGKKRPCDQSSEVKPKIVKIVKKSNSVKDKIVCSYCSKTGHRLPQCNLRQKDILSNIKKNEIRF